MKRIIAASIAAAAIAGAAPGTARADSTDAFYKGKTLTIYVGVSPGGIYGTFALMLSKHLKKHMPGNPEVIVQFMRGAGGTKAVNYVYNVAPKDGTVVITPNAGVTKRVVLGIGKPKYDPAKFNWLGGWGEAVNTLSLRSDGPVRSINDATKTVAVLGAIGKSSNTYMMPQLLNNTLGTKFRIITGYRGGSPIRAAIEKNEVHGWAGQWLGWKLRKPDWVRDGKIVHLLQMASKRAADLPNVKLLTEFAKDADQRAMFKFVQTGIGDRALVAPPGVPKDRLAALEKAYMATLRDPDFLADAKKRSYVIDPISGARITEFVRQIVNTPKSLVAKLRAGMGLTKK